MKPSKTKTVYVCQACGSQSPRWMGKCPDCGAWNTMVEERQEKQKDVGAAKRGGGAEPLLLGEIEAKDEDRFATRIGELDRVLGGGIVSGSVVLIGGDPRSGSESGRTTSTCWPRRSSRRSCTRPTDSPRRSWSLTRSRPSSPRSCRQ